MLLLSNGERGTMLQINCPRDHSDAPAVGHLVDWSSHAPQRKVPGHSAATWRERNAKARSGIEKNRARFCVRSARSQQHKIVLPIGGKRHAFACDNRRGSFQPP